MPTSRQKQNLQLEPWDGPESFDLSPSMLGQLRWLKFKSELEPDYAEYVLRSNQRSASICGLIVLVIWLCFAVLDFFRIDLEALYRFDWRIILWLGGRWLALASLLVALFASGFFYRSYTWLALSCYVIIGMATGVSSNLASGYGAFHADSSQIVAIMAAFLPLGVMFRQALLAACLVCAWCIAWSQSWINYQSPAANLQIIFMMLVAVPIAGVGGYFREYADRKQYLLSRVLERHATTDTLTGLHNRRGFERHFDTVLRQAKREKKMLGVALADLDFFKQYNDTYGHVAGDEVLRETGTAMAKTARRPLDMVARYGGEEFILLFYGTDEAGVRQRLEAAISNINTLAREHRHGIAGRVTASFGYTIANAPSDTLEEVVARADQALYLAKSRGRNQIVFAPDNTPEFPKP